MSFIGSWPVVQKKTHYHLHYLQEQLAIPVCNKVTGYFYSDLS